jgi:hypothetical protein
MLFTRIVLFIFVVLCLPCNSIADPWPVGKGQDKFIYKASISLNSDPVLEGQKYGFDYILEHGVTNRTSIGIAPKFSSQFSKYIINDVEERFSQRTNTVELYTKHVFQHNEERVIALQPSFSFNSFFTGKTVTCTNQLCYTKQIIKPIFENYGIKLLIGHNLTKQRFDNLELGLNLGNKNIPSISLHLTRGKYRKGKWLELKELGFDWLNRQEYRLDYNPLYPSSIREIIIAHQPVSVTRFKIAESISYQWQPNITAQIGISSYFYSDHRTPETNLLISAWLCL